ncbi:hypothetical protein ACFYZ9_33845 [Streptomyces sp. NPDC001691]|uniref:hypothetical protein n=1 Tax=Streptomyces sp. NPDC001691 TaxID=3364600 RepID=UPI0036A04F33
MAGRVHRERPERTYLPGILDVRICGDEATVKDFLDDLEGRFRATTAREYDGGQRVYLRIDMGCTDPDAD